MHNQLIIVFQKEDSRSAPKHVTLESKVIFIGLPLKSYI